jgi:hypothetical protein
MEQIMSASPILEIGNMRRFNNKLSFLKSVTTLIILHTFLLGIANHEEAHSEE